MKLPIAAAIFSMMMFQTNANAFWLDIVKEFVAGGIKSVVMPKKIIDESSNPNINNSKVKKMKLFLSLLALTFGISIAAKENTSDIKDRRDGKTYRTVKLGKQIWMAENLNYEVEGSKCYDNKPANCEKYGRLYDWKTAKTVCPTGWHLPSDEEWETLIGFVGGGKTAGKYLKSKSGWGDGNGTDSYGFLALPGGWGSSDDSFSSAGKYGNWWSSSEYSSYQIYYQNINYYHETALYVNSGKSYFQSVRCVRD